MSDRIDRVLEEARSALRGTRTLSSSDRRRALERVAEHIALGEDAILRANAADCDRADGLSEALRDRLRLTPQRVAGMVTAVRDIAELQNPLGEERRIGTGQSGIEVFRRRIPIGVLAVVYEARPNVTAECAALALASGNAIILRGGKEARASNEAIGAAVSSALEQAGLPKGLVAVLADSTHDEVSALLGAVGRVDLVIPRGGERLMRLVDEHARVPVIRHGQGVCHLYVDKAADAHQATAIAENAKAQRPGVCNALECLLVHRDQLDALAALLAPRLEAAGVEVRADDRARSAWARAGVAAQPAEEKDWGHEFHALTLAVRTVESLDEALEHIERFGSHHTEAIVTTDDEAAERFLGQVDASCVLTNASTRFNDGGALGLGGEMGISTTRMHAYGPMSVRELTTEKWVVRGRGQIRT